MIIFVESLLVGLEPRVAGGEILERGFIVVQRRVVPEPVGEAVREDDFRPGARYDLESSRILIMANDARVHALVLLASTTTAEGERGII